jgi:hypothetical protein
LMMARERQLGQQVGTTFSPRSDKIYASP